MERENELRLTQEFKMQKELQSLASKMLEKVKVILTTNAKWLDEKSRRSVTTLNFNILLLIII